MAQMLAGGAVALSMFLSATSLFAHHGWSGYGSGNVLTLTGPIDRVVYTNPHVEFALKAGDKTWSAVLAPLFRMESRSLPNGSLKVGDTVTLVGYPHRTNTSEIRAERIVVAEKTVELR